MACTCCPTLLKFLTILWILLGLVLTVLGIVCCVMVGKVLLWMSLIILIAGVVLIFISIFGCLGAAANEPGKECRFVFLYAYFFVILFVVLTVLVMGTFCLVARDKVMAIIDANLQAFTAEFATTSLAAYVDKIMANMTYVGIAGIVVGTLLILALLTSGWVLGLEKVIRSTLFIGNIVVIGVGVALIAFGIWVYTTLRKMDNVSGMLSVGPPIILGIAGIVVSLTGFLGWLGACCVKCTRPFLIIYLVLMTILTGLIVGIGIALFCYAPQIANAVTNLCNQTDYYTTCATIMSFVSQQSGTNVTTADMQLIAAALTAWFKGNFNMIAVAGIYCGLFILYLLLAGFIGCCKNWTHMRARPSAQTGTAKTVAAPMV